MRKQLNKNPPDWRTVISGKRNNDRDNSGSGIASTGLCIERLQRIGLYAPPIACLQKNGNPDGVSEQVQADTTRKEENTDIRFQFHYTSPPHSLQTVTSISLQERKTQEYIQEDEVPLFFLVGSMESRTPVSIRQEINVLLLIHPGSEYMTAAS